MSRIGGALDQLSSLQGNFRQQSEAVAHLTSALDNAVGATYWEGPAAQRFRDAWQGQFKSALAQLRAALDDASLEVGRRRDALQQAGS